MHAKTRAGPSGGGGGNNGRAPSDGSTMKIFEIGCVNGTRIFELRAYEKRNANKYTKS